MAQLFVLGLFPRGGKALGCTDAFHPSRFSLSSKALGCTDAFHPSRFSLSSKALGCTDAFHPSRFSLSSKALGCTDAFHPSRFSLSSKVVLRGWKHIDFVSPKLIKLKLAYTTAHLNAGVTIIMTTCRGPLLRMNPQCLAMAANRREYSDCSSRTNNYMLIRYGISFYCL